MAVKNTTHSFRLIAQSRLGRIGVLMGGPSTEREISLKSGRGVSEALRQSHLEVIPIDIKTDDIKENIRLIKSHKIDCAFIALHGRFGEDGQIQEILDGLKVPYTGSGALASRLAMDKIASRKICEVHGIAVPRYRVIERSAYYPRWKSENNLNFPLVVKPAAHGSSIGLSIADNPEELNRAVDLAFGFDKRILVEEYIEGRELTVGILDNTALPVIEVIPKKRLFDYEAKYQTGMTDYVVPAPLKEDTAKKVQRVAMSVHQLLGCFGCSRVDMILTKEEVPFVLELNSIPGLTSTSLLPKAAKVVGIEFTQLCLELIKLAYARTPCVKKSMSRN